ncbi:hypothetical protein FKM82_023790 [Ascaphus truei]
MESRQASVRQTTSAGYRLPDTGSAQLGSASSASCSKLLPGAQATQNRPPLGSRDEGKQRWGDAVGQDRVWREYVEAERRGGKRWHEHWSFLKEYDSLGNKKDEEMLPEHAPVISGQIPNTTSQNIGSRINTDLGKALVHMDYFLTGGNQRKTFGNELLPC